MSGKKDNKSLSYHGPKETIKKTLKKVSTQTLAFLPKSLKDYIPASNGHQELKAVLTMYIDNELQLRNAGCNSGLK